MLSKWTQRYFLLLNQPKGLVYFEHPVESGPYKNPLGFIDFATITEVKRESTQEDVILLISQERIWHLLGSDEQETVEWQSEIRSTVERLQKEEYSLTWDANFGI